MTWQVVKSKLDGMPRGSAHKLSKLLGINPSDFYRRLKRGTELTETQARSVRAFFHNPEALPNLVQEPDLPTARPGDNELPVYGYAAASDGDRIVLNEGQILDWTRLPMGITLGPGEYFAVRPSGSSMEPRIFAGELQVVLRNYPPAKGKDAVIEFHDGTAVIKTYEGERSGRVWARQYNEAKMLDYDASTVKAIHAVAFKL